MLTADFLNLPLPIYPHHQALFPLPVSDFQKPETEKATEERKEASVWKVAAALIGPGTLFLKDSKRGMELQKMIETELKMEQKKRGHYAVDEEHVCRTFRCLGCSEMADGVRVKLAEAVAREGLEVVQMERGECSVFRADGIAGSGGRR